jgi:hypothetical protein
MRDGALPTAQTVGTWTKRVSAQSSKPHYINLTLVKIYARFARRASGAADA